jgi:DNA-binding transcriptional LysR family regulator
MTLEQLRIFAAVAARLHVTRAAQDLNLTQSAASAAIAALEARYEVKLFHRIGRRIELTDAGTVFLAEAKAVLQRAAAAELALTDLSGLARGTLTLHASQTIANYWLPPVMWRFRERYPAIELTLKIGNTEQVAAAVLEGVTDLGLVEGPVEHELIKEDEIAGDELELVVAPDHPWARRPPEGAEGFVDSAWVLRESGSGTRQVFDRVLEKFGIAPESLQVALVLPSNEAVRVAVEAGAGATILSRLVVDAALATGALVRVATPVPARAFALVRHRERHESRASLAFRNMAMHS